MIKKTLLILTAVTFSSAGMASYFYVTNHSHEENSVMSEPLGHSGRTDANGGHNCSQKSQEKGLCSGYHYHR